MLVLIKMSVWFYKLRISTLGVTWLGLGQSESTFLPVSILFSLCLKFRPVLKKNQENDWLKLLKVYSSYSKQRNWPWVILLMPSTTPLHYWYDHFKTLYKWQIQSCLQDLGQPFKINLLGQERVVPFRSVFWFLGVPI